MIHTNAYSYINVLDKALDASNLRETVITNNLANINTPGYKRREVDFESLLHQELDKIKWNSLDEKISDVNLSHLDAGCILICRRTDTIIAWMVITWMWTLKMQSLRRNSFVMSFWQTVSHRNFPDYRQRSVHRTDQIGGMTDGFISII